MGGSASNVDGKALHPVAIQQGCFTRRQIVSHNDRLLGLLLGSRELLSQQSAKELLLNVGEVVGPLRNVLRLHLLKTPVVSSQDDRKGVLCAVELRAYALHNFAPERGIRNHVAMALEDLLRELQLIAKPGYLLVHLGDGLLDGTMEALDFALDHGLSDRPSADAQIFLAQHNSLPDANARRYGYPSLCLHMALGSFFAEVLFDQSDHCRHGLFGILTRGPNPDPLSLFGAQCQDPKDALGVHFFLAFSSGYANGGLKLLGNLGQTGGSPSVEAVSVGDFNRAL